MVIAAKPKRSLQVLIDDRDAKNQCIVCGVQCDHDKNRRKRGLCKLHHGRYIANRPEDPKAAAKYDAESIEAGELMPDRQGQRIGQENTYKQRARKVS